MRASRFALEPRARRAALLVAATTLLLLSAPADAKRRDQTPPTFGGLESATTCIPGPIGNGTPAKYNLNWQPATDNVSPSRRIVYDVYQAATSRGEDFSTPTYTTAAGATSFTTPPLRADKPVYFVVRARDQAGNRDSNTVEREGQNLCV
jgi:hypothetical protein